MEKSSMNEYPELNQKAFNLIHELHMNDSVEIKGANLFNMVKERLDLSNVKYKFERIRSVVWKITLVE
jgi:hypothetical protein